MKSIFLIILVVFTQSGLFSQAQNSTQSGSISFITSENIYVRFDKTTDIKIGDTLFIGSVSNLKACLIVTQKSSTSCVTESINNCSVSLNDSVQHIRKSVVRDIEEVVNIPETKEQKQNQIEREEDNVSKTSSDLKEQISGRLSASSYSNFSSNYNARHRAMMRFSLNARNLNDSKFSIESYVNYSQNFIAPNESYDRQTKFLRVYNLSVNYDVDPTLSISLGRKINHKISSLGAIDGVQVEKQLNHFYTGLVVGFRPDIFEYDFNPRLFQFGGYIGARSNSKDLFAETTLGILEQRNGAAIDRRYMYFQHSSTISKNLNLFGSFELDIFNSVSGISGASPRLTNLFVSARYRFSRQVSLSVSYDARKRIIYYETLKTEVERLLDDDEARQGIRLRLNVKPFNYVFAGITYSKRFQNNSQNKSNNLNGFVSFSRIPGIGGRINLNYNKNESNYLSTDIVSLRYARTLVSKRLEGDFYYRIVDYTYVHNELSDRQSYYGVNLSYRINKKWSFSLLGELATRSTENNYRFNSKISTRI